MPATFLDARGDALGHRKGWMLLTLEAYCRARCYCWAGNRELARAFGCSESALLNLLGEMEADGLIHRVRTHAGRPGRVGIILLKRADPDLPTAARDEIPDVARRMGESRAGHRDRGRGQTPLPLGPPEPDPETGGHDPGKLGAMTPENWGHHDPRKLGAELRVVVVEKDEPEDDPGGYPEPFDRSRQRPEPPPEPGATSEPGPPLDVPPAITPGSIGAVAGTPASAGEGRGREDRCEQSRRRQLAALAARRTPRPATPDPPAAAPPGPPHSPVVAGAGPPRGAPPAPPAAPLTGGQEGFLEYLSPPQRARLDALPTGGRAAMLERFRGGFDPAAAIEAIRSLFAGPGADRYRELPGTTAALLESLPGAPAHWAAVAAGALVRDFGGPRDGQLWAAFLEVTSAVRGGAFPVGSLLDAYRQAMNPGSKNRGAVFNTSLQRDHGWDWAAVKVARRCGPSSPEEFRR